MSLLEQQELIEAPPRRRLVVAEGHTAYWGLDPSTLRVVIAGVATGEAGPVRWVRTEPFAKTDGVARLGEIHGVTYETVRALARVSTPPGLVMVEQPSGKIDNPQLVYAVGVIQAAVWTALRDSFGQPVRVETCTSSWWKARACGRGNISKTHRVPGRARPVPVPLEEYGVLVWARQNGYAGSSWDEADAWGVAEAARREVELLER